MKVKIIFVMCLIFIFNNYSYAMVNNSIRENERQYGKSISSTQYSQSWFKYSGKEIYQHPFFGWQVEVLYKDGKSIAETARPKGKNVKKPMISEQEANVIADSLFTKRDRGDYKKQVKNANFISHFFENGVVSYEMKLDDRKRNYMGIIGVRTVLYSDGARFKDIKINAYH